MEDVNLVAGTFNTESCCDYLTVNGQQFRGSLGPTNLLVPAGANMITWYSDSSAVLGGFEICTSESGEEKFVGCSYASTTDRV